MIHLVKHFLRRMRPKAALFMSLITVVCLLGSWQFSAAKLEQGWVIGFMMATTYGMMSAALILEAEDFDLVLPVRRRTLYLAHELATLSFMVFMALPVSAAALAIAAFQGAHGETLRSCATFALFWIAILLTALAFLRLVKRIFPPLAILMAAVMLLGFCFPWMMTLRGKITSLLPAAVAAVAAVPAWFLGSRQSDRYELVPPGSEESAQVRAARPSLTDRFSPMVRVLAHTLWLRWWYSVVIFFVAFYCLMFTAIKWPNVWIFYLVYAGCGAGILQLFSGIGQSLLPLVPRRTILRSVLGPIAAVPLLIGGIEAVAADSAQMIVRGLAIASVTLGMTWLALPSAKEYGRPYMVRLRRNLSVIPSFCFIVCALVPAVKDFIGRLLSVAGSHAAPSIAGDPLLVSCVIALAIALLWWRCERKFRDFEPFALPSGFTRTA